MRQKSLTLKSEFENEKPITLFTEGKYFEKTKSKQTSLHSQSTYQKSSSKKSKSINNSQNNVIIVANHHTIVPNCKERTKYQYAKICKPHSLYLHINLQIPS
jgi:hypothetical protein